MRVVWTDTARRNLRTIHDYIAQDSPAYAKRMVDNLTGRSKQIGVFPLSGRVVPEFELDQIREVFQHPYRIIYLFGLIGLMRSAFCTCRVRSDRNCSAYAAISVED